MKRWRYKTEETRMREKEEEEDAQKKKEKKNPFYLQTQEGWEIPFIFIFSRSPILSATLVPATFCYLSLIGETPAGKSQLIFEHHFGS